MFLTKDLVELMQSLWTDPGLQAIQEFCSELGLSHTACVFLDNIEKIAQSEYMPSEQDILHTRKKTTGIVELIFEQEVNIKSNSNLSFS